MATTFQTPNIHDSGIVTHEGITTLPGQRATPIQSQASFSRSGIQELDSTGHTSTDSFNRRLTFSYDLWDQMPAIDTYVSDGSRISEQITDFMKRRAHIESEYAKDLSKLAMSFLPPDEKRPKRIDEGSGKNTLISGWVNLLNQTRAISEEHRVISEKLNVEVVDVSRVLGHEKVDSHKRMSQEAQSIKDEMKKQYRELDKSKSYYDRKSKEFDEAKLAFDSVDRNVGSSKDKLEKTRIHMDHKAERMREAEENYNRNLKEVNERQRTAFHQRYPNILNQMQQMEENRIIRLRDLFMVYAEVQSLAIPAIQTNVDAIRTSTQQIDPHQDIDDFIQENRSGEPIPEDIAFMPFNPSMGRSGSFGPSHINRRSQQVPDTSFQNLPSEQKYLLLHSRVKELEKDLADIEKDKADIQLNLAGLSVDDQTTMGQREMLEFRLEDSDRNADVTRTEIERYKDMMRQMTQSETVPSSAAFHPLPEVPNAQSYRATPSLGTVHSGEVQPSERVAESTPGIPLAAQVYGTSQGPAQSAEISGEHNVRALYDYEGKNDTELSFKSGQDLQILDRDKSGWWKARIGDKTGYVPRTFLDISQ